MLALALLLGGMIALDNGLGRSGPAMGFSSWNFFGGNGSHGHGRLNATTLTEITDAMVSNGLRDAGYVYVNLGM
jgi:alpha-galactosidase